MICLLFGSSISTSGLILHLDLGHWKPMLPSEGPLVLQLDFGQALVAVLELRSQVVLVAFCHSN